MYKLSISPSGQMAAHGNVCILPQDSSSFVAAMPAPLFRIRDKICVILVGSPDTEVTQDMLRKSPLLVRREWIRRALFWLIENNPLYADLNKISVLENLEEYPEYNCPLATADFLRTNSATTKDPLVRPILIKQILSYAKAPIHLSLPQQHSWT
ncbi:hypothetical protein C8F04DRAFT_973106 [Mycena alexandri]|uniref:DUF6570 domain-containing protein n=1 Tax=Mycena alexandri TaxID=1745969 RepID=A0AAD6WRU2_9AGAR|nr:hypothetical protein C8F04DRAFT_973106 [Mycena alexandri]